MAWFTIKFRDYLSAFLVKQLITFTSVSQTGFHRTLLGVPREIVEKIRNYFEIKSGGVERERRITCTSKYRQNICMAITGEISVR